MQPYYERDGIVIYHGDCRDIVPTLSGVDMVVTDPPYGVEYRGGHFHSGDVRIQNKRESLVRIWRSFLWDLTRRSRRFGYRWPDECARAV